MAKQNIKIEISDVTKLVLSTDLEEETIVPVSGHSLPIRRSLPVRSREAETLALARQGGT